MTEQQEAPTPAPQHRLEPNHIEPTHHGRFCSMWVVRTPHALADVLAPGYFDSVRSHGVRLHDRIYAVTEATVGGGVPVDLIVTAAPRPIDGPITVEVFTPAPRA